MATRIYLDHAATTPVLAEALDAMAEGLLRWANPSSPHAAGRAARAALEDARERVKAELDWPHGLIFTSGASEALGIALRRAKADRRVISAVEHDAVRRAVPDAAVLPVSEDGVIETDLIADGGALVAVQSVNNETGVIQPLDEVARRVRAGGGLLLADCAQSAGKLPLPDADFIAISAHKLGGPPGLGVLLVKDFATLAPTGGQEQGYRIGTENLPGALGFAAALEARRGWLGRAEDLRAHLDASIEREGGTVVARGASRFPAIGSYRMPGVAATAQLIQFDMAGIAVSAGSACSSGSLKPSHVLAAMGWSEEASREVIRVSFGPGTNRTEIWRFAELWGRFARDARARAA